MTGPTTGRVEAAADVDDSPHVEIEIQEALVHLWTSAEARQDFLRDRTRYLDRLSLSQTAFDRLQQLDARQLDAFATSLVLKRLAQVREFFSDIAARLPDAFDDQFRTWAANHPPASTRHHEDDALRFGQHLLAQAPSPEIRERLRWRLLHLRLARPGWRIGLTTFRHDILATDQGALPGRFSVWFWWGGGTTRGRMIRLY